MAAEKMTASFIPDRDPKSNHVIRIFVAIAASEIQSDGQEWWAEEPWPDGVPTMLLIPSLPGRSKSCKE